MPNIPRAEALASWLNKSKNATHKDTVQTGHGKSGSHWASKIHKVLPAKLKRLYGQMYSVSVKNKLHDDMDYINQHGLQASSDNNNVRVSALNNVRVSALAEWLKGNLTRLEKVRDDGYGISGSYWASNLYKDLPTNIQSLYAAFNNVNERKKVFEKDMKHIVDNGLLRRESSPELANWTSPLTGPTQSWQE